MEPAKLQAWWAHRQGLDGQSQGASAEQVLERSGWARSVGGIGPYLTLFSRAGIGRAAADLAVAELRIHELPAARGCTYVVPESEFALALRVGQEFSQAPMKTAARLGVTEKEIDKLCQAVLRALGDGPLDPEQIREATGKASRNLGEEGKKKGVTTTLPLALGQLQAAGEIRRVATNGRLDQQRYRYARWSPNPLSGGDTSPADAYVELARRFFRWIGPATLAEFQWFSGLGVKASKLAVAPLGLVACDDAGDRLMLAEDVKEFGRFRVPARPRYMLVSSLDAIHAHRRDGLALLDPKDQDHATFKGQGAKPMGGLSDLPSHAILDRGRLVGFWEYDPAVERIVWRTFRKEAKELEAAVHETEAFVRDQVGDARAFSLDTPASREPKIAALREHSRL